MRPLNLLWSFARGWFASTLYTYIFIFLGMVKFDPGVASNTKHFAFSLGEAVSVSVNWDINLWLLWPIVISFILWLAAYNLTHWIIMGGGISSTHPELVLIWLTAMSYVIFGLAWAILPITFSLFPLWHLVIGVVYALTYFVFNFENM